MSWKRRVRGSSAFMRARRVVMARDEFCYLCGEYVDKTLPRYHPLSPEVDHIKALAEGGEATDVDNLALTHRQCNLLKGSKDFYKVDKSELKKLVVAKKEEFSSSGTDWLGE